MKRRAILLVEDDPDVAEALAELLTDEGFVVAIAANGLEGLTYLQTHDSPSVILLDLMMPVMDGYTFRAAQRADPRLASIPVFCISAGAMDHRLGALDLAGAFKKPIDVAALLGAIRQQLA